MHYRQSESQAQGAPSGSPQLEALSAEVARLRRTVLKHGHAQELFQTRVEASMTSLRESMPSVTGKLDETPPEALPKPLSTPQLRTLMELAQAAQRLLDLAAGTAADQSDAPRSVREGLGLLAIRITNLQRSFGLEPIPTRGQQFNDRLHQAHGLCHRPELEDGRIAAEVLPGYFLDGEVVRPALVIVNQWPQPGHSPTPEEASIPHE